MSVVELTIRLVAEGPDSATLTDRQINRLAFDLARAVKTVMDRDDFAQTGVTVSDWSIRDRRGTIFHDHKNSGED